MRFESLADLDRAFEQSAALGELAAKLALDKSVTSRRLRDATGPLAGYPADVIAARLRSTTINFSVEEPRDDIAILVLRNDA